MDIGSLLLGLALLLLVVFIVAWPLLERRPAPEKEISQADPYGRTNVFALLAERERLLTALRDLDFDHATGKISDEDYAPQRAQLVAQGIEVLRRLDGVMGDRRHAIRDTQYASSAGGASETLSKDGKAGAEEAIERAIAARRKSRPVQSVDDLIEAEIAARRKVEARSPLQGMTCPHCSASARPDDRFCHQCGRPLYERTNVSAPACPACGRPLQPGDRFCATCGANV